MSTLKSQTLTTISFESSQKPTAWRHINNQNAAQNDNMVKCVMRRRGEGVTFTVTLSVRAKTYGQKPARTNWIYRRCKNAKAKIPTIEFRISRPQTLFILWGSRSSQFPSSHLPISLIQSGCGSMHRRHILTDISHLVYCPDSKTGAHVTWKLNTKCKIWIKSFNG